MKTNSVLKFIPKQNGKFVRKHRPTAAKTASTGHNYSRSSNTEVVHIQMWPLPCQLVHANFVMNHWTKWSKQQVETYNWNKKRLVSSNFSCCTSILLPLISAKLTDIQGRSQTSYTAPCNGVVSHGAQIGGLRVFADHTHKNKRKANASRTFTSHAVFYACLSSRSDRCRWRTHLTNQDYFDYVKNSKTPNLSLKPG